MKTGAFRPMALHYPCRQSWLAVKYIFGACFRLFELANVTPIVDAHLSLLLDQSGGHFFTLMKPSKNVISLLSYIRYSNQCNDQFGRLCKLLFCLAIKHSLFWGNRPVVSTNVPDYAFCIGRYIL